MSRAKCWLALCCCLQAGGAGAADANTAVREPAAPSPALLEFLGGWESDEDTWNEVIAEDPAPAAAQSDAATADKGDRHDD
jgi:hypothetical protein